MPPTQGGQPGEPQNTEIEILNASLWPASSVREGRVEQQKEPVAIEVSMLPQTRRLLRDFPVPGLERPYLMHLEQRIARNPRDLLSHVRRLYLADALGDPDAVAGALADLFLVLGRHGKPLRRRVLKLVGTRLTADQVDFFESRLEQGLDASEAIPEIPQSRLSKRVEGTTRIVFRSDRDATGTEDPVHLARDSIANGLYDVAQAVLEGALESDPGNREVCEELLDLYRDRDLRSSFFKTYTALLGRQLACRDRWDALARKYRSRASSDA